MTILIVDDAPTDNLYLSALAIGAGHDVVVAESPFDGLTYAERDDPALVVVDYVMPGLDGVQFIRKLREKQRHASTPIMMISGSDQPMTRLAALEAGATDFMAKPVDAHEWRIRLRNLTQLTQDRGVIASLREELAQAAGVIRDREIEMVSRLVRMAKHRDTEAGDHIVRSGDLAAAIARRMGFGEPYCEQLGLAMQLHDVGKVGVPDRVLNKPGLLTPGERAEINEHVRYGCEILSNSSSALIQLAEEIARTHHERWNGTGYPLGLSGEDIPLSGRIAAVADVYDALTSKRPYKAEWSRADALRFLTSESDRLFDPNCVHGLGCVFDAAH